MLRRIKNRLRRIKWWFQRANGKVTPPDWWDYKYTLADNIKQGIEGLLYEGNTDWDCDYHKQEKKDLEFILKWAKDFPKYESGIVALNTDDYHLLQIVFAKSEVLIMTQNEYKEFQKRTKKAFELLGRNFSTLWD